MVDKCDLILRDLPEDLFEEGELNKLTEELNDAVKSDAGRDQLDKIKQRIKDNKFQKLDDAQKIKYHTLIKKAEAMEEINQYPNKVRGLMANLVGMFAKADRAGASADADGKTRASMYNRRLQVHLKLGKVWDYFQDKNNISDVAQALFKEEDAPNDKAKKVAKIIKDIYKEQISMLNSRGANIQELKDFISSQVHNRSKMIQTADTWADRMKNLKEAYDNHGGDIDSIKKFLAEKAFNRWHDFIRPLIDDDRTFKPDMSDADKEKTLKKIYGKIVVGKSVSDETIFKSIDDDLFDKSIDRTKAIDKHRFIHFKDSESFTNYNSKFGSGDLRSSIINTIDGNSKNIAILERMGVSPDSWYRLIRNDIKRNSDDPNIEKHLAKADMFFKVVMSRDKQPVNHLWANIFSGARHLEAMAHLGGVVLKALPDVVQEASSLRSNGVGFLDRYRTILTQSSILMDKETQNFLMDSLGVMNVMGHFNNRVVGLDDAPGKLTKAMAIYFKATGMEHWDKSMRLGFAGGLARHLANLRNKGFDSLPDGLQRTFRRYGINDQDWDTIRSNTEGMKNIKGKYYVTPDLATSLSDESIKNHLGKDSITAKDRANVKDEIEFKLQQYFLEETDTAQLSPGAADRAMLLRGHQPGTVAGELLRSLYQFKSYGFNATRRGLGRLLLQNSNDGLMKSLLKGNVSYRGLLEYMTSAAIMGYISTASTSMLKNGYVPNPENPSVWGSSLVDGGGFGMFGDYLFHNYNGYGHGLIEMAAGPLAGSAADMAKLMSTLESFNDKGHRLSYHDRVLKNVLQLTKQNTPFANLFYAKAMFQYLFNHHIMNYVDPGYSSQHQANVRAQNKGNMQLF